MVALEFMDSVRHHGRQTSCHRPGNEHHYRGAVWDLFAHRSVGQHGSPTLDPTAGQREVDDVHGSVGEPVEGGQALGESPQPPPLAMRLCP